MTVNVITKSCDIRFIHVDRSIPGALQIGLYVGEGMIIGAAIVSDCDSYWCIEKMMVSPQYRKQGHGTFFLKAILDWLTQNGSKACVWLLPDRQSDHKFIQLCRWYRKHGFRWQGDFMVRKLEVLNTSDAAIVKQEM